MNRRNASQTSRLAKAKRQQALDRVELRSKSAERIPADSPTSFPVKAIPESLRAMIDAALTKRAANRI